MINKPCISVAFVKDIYHICYFLQKKEVSFEVSFGGLLFSGRLLLSGFVNTCDILSLLSKVCYSQGVVTFRTLR